MLLLTISPISLFPEDDRTVVNALTLNSDNIYSWVGSDSDASNRDLRATFSFNYFRLGETRRESPNSSVQRRIAIVNGSTSELLYSQTPIGTGREVFNQINARADEMIANINSVSLVAETPPEVNVTDAQLVNGNFIIQFSSQPGQANSFTVLSSPDLSSFDLDVTAQAQIIEVTEGNYQASIPTTGSTRTFFQLQLPQ